MREHETHAYPAHAASGRLNAVLGRIADACTSAHRSPETVTLLAVSKTWNASRVLELAALGQRAFAENYLQEALEKIGACRAVAPDLVWHFIGPIQSNKTKPIAEQFDWVHSIDRDKIARRLSEQRPDHLPPLQVCIQVNVSGEGSKSGCPPEQAQALALAVASLPRLRLRGLMAIPEPSTDVGLQRARFALLARLARQIRKELATTGSSENPGARDFSMLSMGMSDDLEAAIAEGATMVRVGTALFGKRPPKHEP